VAGATGNAGGSTPAPPSASTSAPLVVSRLTPSVHNTLVAPISWFTVGAPAVSSLVGLTLLAIAALLPGRGGFPRNDPVQYGLWGVQGAATLGECLANLGFSKGIIYLAPCMIDIMFFGFDVAWVFFDGLPHNFPEREIRCAPYSQWPVINSSACGDCLALVPTEPFGGRCNRYCESFGHRCVFAALNDDCQPISRYGCDEVVPVASDMLCQCQQEAPSQAGNCAPYSQWPNIEDPVCGNCTALVSINRIGRSCSDYCESFGHRCIEAAESREAIDCQRFAPLQCDSVVTSRALCTCEGVQQLQQPCNNYSEWPHIVNDVCGNCEAIVPANGPLFGIQFSTCDAFCRDFGHECVRAIDTNSCGFISVSSETLGCNQRATQTQQRCQCALPGRAALLT